uniref:Uncharacterized protein n=1 Tax=Alexandrium monilatum TaxID=311494 RepID=A0A7S4UIG4_9DINO|mmetsp:Transcript_49349/g.155182  ORF Transcript_49349/g.155182 Transcript_49349/m.155182 type:complete len:587 (+) Transcript_49349:120-1880(+)
MAALDTGSELDVLLKLMADGPAASALSKDGARRAGGSIVPAGIAAESSERVADHERSLLHLVACPALPPVPELPWLQSQRTVARAPTPPAVPPPTRLASVALGRPEAWLAAGSRALAEQLPPTPEPSAPRSPAAATSPPIGGADGPAGPPASGPDPPRRRGLVQREPVAVQWPEPDDGHASHASAPLPSSGAKLLESLEGAWVHKLPEAPAAWSPPQCQNAPGAAAREASLQRTPGAASSSSAGSLKCRSAPEAESTWRAPSRTAWMPLGVVGYLQLCLHLVGSVWELLLEDADRIVASIVGCDRRGIVAEELDAWYVESLLDGCHPEWEGHHFMRVMASAGPFAGMAAVGTGTTAESRRRAAMLALALATVVEYPHHFGAMTFAHCPTAFFELLKEAQVGPVLPTPAAYQADGGAEGYLECDVPVDCLQNQYYYTPTAYMPMACTSGLVQLQLDRDPLAECAAETRFPAQAGSEEAPAPSRRAGACGCQAAAGAPSPGDDAPGPRSGAPGRGRGAGGREEPTMRRRDLRKADRRRLREDLSVPGVPPSGRAPPKPSAADIFNYSYGWVDFEWSDAEAIRRGAAVV